MKRTGFTDQWPSLRYLIAMGVTILPVIVFGLFQFRRFDGLYGQDPYAYFDYATGPLLTALRNRQPLPPFFWPPGYPLLVALGETILGPLSNAGQSIALIAGSLVPLFTALVAWEISLSNRLAVSLLAGIVAGFTGQLWQSSVVVMADTTALAAITCGCFALLRYSKKPLSRTNWLILAAGSFAYAILTRWAAALPAIVGTVFTLYTLSKLPAKLALRQAFVAGFTALIILSPVLFTTLRQANQPETDRQAFTGDLQVYRWNPATAIQNSHNTSDGLLNYRLPNGLYYALAPAHRYIFTPLLALFLLPGIITLLQRLRDPQAAFLLAWPAVVYLFHAGTPWQNLRFTLTYLPPLAICLAIGVLAVHEYMRPSARPVLYILILGGLIMMAIGGATLTDSLIQRNAQDLDTAMWTEQEVKPGSQLITFAITLTISHHTKIETYDLFHLDQTLLKDLLQEDQQTYLLLDLDNIEQQWAGRKPWTLYQWLRDGPGISEIGKFQAYTLFLVGSADL